MGYIRHMRNTEFGALELDRKQQTAIVNGDMAAAQQLETWKQQLRDMPQMAQVEMADKQTPEEIRAVWPVGLPRWAGPNSVF
jgi:hypothetical protein